MEGGLRVGRGCLQTWIRFSNPLYMVLGRMRLAACLLWHLLSRRDTYATDRLFATLRSAETRHAAYVGSSLSLSGLLLYQTECVNNHTRYVCALNYYVCPRMCMYVCSALRIRMYRCSIQVCMSGTCITTTVVLSMYFDGTIVRCRMRR